MYVPSGGESQFGQRNSEHTWWGGGGYLCGPRRDNKLVVAPPLENKREYQHPPFPLQDPEKAWSLGILPQEGARNAKQMYPQKVGKTESLPGLMEGISLQRQLAKIEEVDCYFKCDDSNTRLQRSNLQVTYLKDSGDLQVTR